jgi:hypothetical protein
MLSANIVAQNPEGSVSPPLSPEHAAAFVPVAVAALAFVLSACPAALPREHADTAAEKKRTAAAAPAVSTLDRDLADMKNPS